MKESKIDPRVKFVREDFLRRVEERLNLERSWLLNLNFYAGNQQSQVLPTGEITEADKRYYWQESEVYNHIAPIVEARLSKFANVRGLVSVVPATNDPADVETARFSTKLLRSVEEENGFKRLVNEATFWSELTGTAFYKVTWSTSKGRCVSPEEGLYEGDVDVTVCPPYEIYPDNLSAGSMEEVRSLIHAKAYPLSVVEEIWGIKPKVGGPVSVFFCDSVTVGGNGIQNGRNRMIRSAEKKDYVTVLERYSLPDAENPDGRLLVVAGDTLLYDGPLPYTCGENGTKRLPFVRQACISQPASFFGSSIVERIIPVQRAYNAIKNRKHEFFNRMTAGVLIAEDGSVDLDELEENGIGPGKVLVYRQGSNAPVMESMGGVPAEFGEEEDRLLSEFVTISGVSDFLLNSGVSTNNLSGLTLKLIMQQDSGRLAMTADNIRFAMKDVGKMILRLYKQFASFGRLKRIAGDNGTSETALFSASDISCEDVAFDVEDETVVSPEIKKETAKEIFEMGLMNGPDGKPDENARLKMLELMGMGNWQSACSEQELHRKKAMRENDMFIDSVPEVESIDSHEIHISEHTSYLLQENCPLGPKERRSLIEHVENHKTLLKTVTDREA